MLAIIYGLNFDKQVFDLKIAMPYFITNLGALFKAQLMKSSYDNIAILSEVEIWPNWRGIFPSLQIVKAQ